MLCVYFNKPKKHIHLVQILCIEWNELVVVEIKYLGSKANPSPALPDLFLLVVLFSNKFNVGPSIAKPASIAEGKKKREGVTLYRKMKSMKHMERNKQNSSGFNCKFTHILTLNICLM